LSGAGLFKSISLSLLAKPAQKPIPMLNGLAWIDKNFITMESRYEKDYNWTGSFLKV